MTRSAPPSGCAPTTGRAARHAPVAAPAPSALSAALSAVLLVAVVASLAACGDVAIIERPNREGDGPGECADDIDNDEDGLFDCDDSDCTLHEACAPNEAPTAPVVVVTPERPLTTDVLSCTMITASEDAEAEEITYTTTWLVDGTDAEVDGATVEAALTTRGETWTCVITPFDPHQAGETGTASVDIENTPPAAPEVSIRPGAPRLEDDLTCTVETDSQDPDGDGISYTYDWFVNGINAGITSRELPFIHTSVNDTWRCDVTPSDGLEAGAVGEAEVGVHRDLEPHASAGGRHSCGVEANATVTCWGVEDGSVHDFGQVADVPIESFAIVSAGERHTCAARGDLTLRCWGDNSNNQTVAPLGSFHSLSAGTNHTCGVETNGDLSCWGSALSWSTLPPAGPFRRVSAGDEFACMVQLDDTLGCWNAPFGPPTGRFQEVAAGDDHACALRLDGSITCFGSNSAGQLNGVPGGTGYTAVSAGADHTCALADTGFVSCWGANGAGQASAASGFFVQVDAGRFHSCGTRSDGAVVCWGCSNNDFGQCSP